MPAHRCVFCLDAERPANSAEHLVSNPIADVFGIDRSERSLLTADLAGESPSIHRLDGSLGEHRVRYVCTPCNNGWMSTLEVAAADLFSEWMTNERRMLSSDEAAVLRRWTLKTHFTVLGLAGQLRGELEGKTIPNVSLAKLLPEGSEGTLADQYEVTVARRKRGEPFSYYISNPQPAQPIGLQLASTVALGLGPVEVRSTICCAPAAVRHPHGSALTQGARMRSVDQARFVLTHEPPAWIDYSVGN